MSLTTGKRVIRNKWKVLPMPAEVIATVHQLAAACKKYKGIVFTDKSSNIINDDDNNNDDNNDGYNNTSEITGVDETIGNNDNTNTEMNITNDNTNTEMNIMNNNINTLDITGVHNNTEEIEATTESQNDNNEPHIAPHTYTNYEQDDTGHNQNGNEQYDNDISIEDESLEDMHITINHINTVHEMNTGQLHVDPNTREEMEWK